MKIAPSILSADFSDLRIALEYCDKAAADLIHLDVMDGHFVPNLTIGPAVVKSLRSHTRTFFDVHIMVSDPIFWIEPFVSAGADGITFHVEAAGRPGEVIDYIRSFGKKVGITLKPSTNIESVEPFLEWVDMILIMSVAPGFGGQTFIPESLDRIKEIQRFLDRQNLSERVSIQVDGGVDLNNAAEIAAAGADILVAGSAIFGTANPADTIQAFRNIFDK
ncbi:MAG: ribulose-phosphate 3-epimerase [Candidatus Marinimicrobia bacterium]|nr:ribulose-phosphate 3-epimerase [Candidatus Neomarinimicrobiota bacterium]